MQFWYYKQQHFALNMKYKNKGFTLIELLTVIAIIGILTALLTVSFGSVRKRGRDVQRKSDIKQIQAAFEFYRTDNDAYPASSPVSPIASCGQPYMGGAGGSQQYMSSIPCDPQTNAAYYYSVGSPASTYVLVSCMENINDKDASAGTVGGKPTWWPTSITWPPITCATGYYYAVSNP